MTFLGTWGALPLAEFARVPLHLLFAASSRDKTLGMPLLLLFWPMVRHSKTRAAKSAAQF